MNGPFSGEGSENTDPNQNGTIDVVAARDTVLSALLGFCRVLRQSGVNVPANAAITAARALVTVGFDDKERVRAALRASLISRQADIATFDRLFPEFWRRLTAGLDISDGPDRPDEPDGQLAPLTTREAATSDTNRNAVSDESAQESISRWTKSSGTTTESENESETTTTARYSPTGHSEPVSIETTVRHTELDRAVRRLTLAIGGLRDRRWSQTGTDHAYARRALRESISTGGTVVSLPQRDRAERAVRAVLLVDVSRSVLDIVDRSFLIRFLHAVSTAWRQVRVFFFDTNIRDVTEPFHAPTDEAAVDALRRAETEWGGGTRIGNALDVVRHEHPDAIDRRTVVFIVSDGLEMGDVDRLEEGMVWLSHKARRSFWLNPLAVSPAYEPTARGMAAALPYTDGLFAFSGPSDLAEIARQLELDRRSIGYEHDPRRTDA
ncbi:vWA domain-containing protein [Halocatena marina]|uniref:VWA domain-containing protein n=1 Tax=Halocatena marina TaxID=2934937 RepID=A0ABD5YS18_9EURY|nr:VWA domain-containing protein [Halocatena marina]